MADSMYHENYWTPQLLYIQSVYYIQQRQDDSAKKSLQDIVRVFPGTPMAAKAKALIDVLSRRKQIEDYLTNLQIQRPAEDSTAEPIAIVSQPVMQQPPVVVTQPIQQPAVTTPAQQPAKPPITQQPPTVPATQQPKQEVAKNDKPVVTPPAQQPAKPPVTQLPSPVIAKKDSVKAK